MTSRDSSAPSGEAPAPAGMPSKPDLVLLHPGVGPETLRAFLQPLWGECDRSLPPPGYRDISFGFHGLRVFCRADCGIGAPPPDPELLRRVAAWVDGLARDWRFAEVFAAQDLDFWDFLRDDLVGWLHARMIERLFLEVMIQGGYGTVVAIGLDFDQRRLLRRLAEMHPGKLRVEVAFLDPPTLPATETLAERRVRKLFFLLQDLWHGVRLLTENLLDRRSKILFVSSASCWQQSLIEAGHGERTDIHLQTAWREGRRRRSRLYYRSDSYHPDVGAMTAGRLAPIYLQHTLFVLAQTSRGSREVRRVQRQWRELLQRPEFRKALVCEGMNVDELIVSWLERALALRLPRHTRDTRREWHFLKGMRPAAIVLSLDSGVQRPILAAARRLGIPSLGIQRQPLPPDACTPAGGPPHRTGSSHTPDRLCVFSAETKRRLIEQGSFNPSEVVVTGDPRLGAAASRGGVLDSAVRDLRARWGVEERQRVIAAVCLVEEIPELLAWMGPALRDREEAFVVLQPIGPHADEARIRYLAACCGLRWFHVLRGGPVADWLGCVDLLVTTRWTELAEALRLGTPSAWVTWAGAEPCDLLAAALAHPAGDAAQLTRTLEAFLAGPPTRLPFDARRAAFVAAVYGEAPELAPGRILETVEQLLKERR